MVAGSTNYRRQGRFWVEGDHLVRAALLHNVRPCIGVFSETFWPLVRVDYAQAAIKTIVVSEVLYNTISTLESPAGMGFVFDLPAAPPLQPHAATVILDRVQDTGNVGAILRSASAFGFTQVMAIQGTAALWSPKVVRAGMGAHWGLHLMEGVSMEAVAQLTVPIMMTSSHNGRYLHQMLQNKELPMPCAWALGHEGQGIGSELAALATWQVRIAQPGGEESLNVASAAAICLHASATATTTAQLG